MAPKTFKGYAPSEPVVFTLESPDGARNITVRCQSSLPGSVFLDFISRTSADDPLSSARAVNDVLRAAVLAEEWDAFKAFIDAPENGIDVETLAEITGYLAESYGQRPTDPSRGS